jgi:TolA-binding protein
MKKVAILLFVILSLARQSRAEELTWYKDFPSASAAARKASKPIFVDVFADWCTWCHKLDKEVYADPKFVSYMKSFVPAKIDSEDGAAGSQFSEKYQITGLPAMIVVDSDGNLLNKISGFMSTTELIEEIDYVDQLLQAEKKNGQSLEATFRLANTYIEREMYDQAKARFQKILASPSANSIQREKAQFSIALADYYQGQLEPALKVLDQYYATYKNGASGEDALLLLSQIHIELNSNEKALKYLREFMQRYPGSGNAVRAKQVLSTLEKECDHC